MVISFKECTSPDIFFPEHCSRSNSENLDLGCLEGRQRPINCEEGLSLSLTGWILHWCYRILMLDPLALLTIENLLKPLQGQQYLNKFYMGQTDHNELLAVLEVIATLCTGCLNSYQIWRMTERSWARRNIQRCGKILLNRFKVL